VSVLSEASLARIAREVAKYPPDQKQSAVMASLAIAQDEHGWLPPAVMDAVAAVLGMPPVAVYEVAECMGACGDAPVLLVNNKRMCGRMSREKLDALVEELSK